MPRIPQFPKVIKSFRPRLSLFILLLGLVAPLLIAACGGGDPTQAPRPAATNTPQPPAATATVAPEPTAMMEATHTANKVEISSEGSLGSHLVDSDGMTLYLYTKDERNVSNCSGGCADAWPPLLVDGDPVAGEGLDAERLLAIKRADGSSQVTYNGKPLYYYAADAKPGDVVGQDKGDVWFLVSPDGGPIRTSAAVNATDSGTLGTILTDPSGNVLYLYTKDERSVSNCSGRCALAWPPLLTVGDPTPGEGLSADRIGVISRGDGAKQVTYNGWPLYYYDKDEKPGDAIGQDRGDVWFVVTTDGGAVYTNAPVNATENGALGSILTDAAGRSLYLYTKDERNVSNCSGGCALAWPPLITVEDPVPGEGLAADRIGTTARADGSKQVTYNGWPLYYYAPDEKPGDAIGQDRGGVWFVVTTDGGAVYTNAPVNAAVHAELGNILVDAAGRSLYLYTKDEPNVSNCAGGCALAWPPLITIADPVPGPGVAAASIGTITREDGSKQVTFGGDPLYYYAPDEKPGDALGQNRGEVWFVINVPEPLSMTLGASQDDTLYETTGKPLNNGAGQWVFAGNTANSELRRGLVTFNIASGLPAGAVVSSVTLTMNMSRSIGSDAAVGLHRVLADWQEGAVKGFGNEGAGGDAGQGDPTWTQRALETLDWDAPGGDFAPAASAAVTVQGAGNYTWNSTKQLIADAQSWLDDPTTNYGWLLQGDESKSKTAKRFDSKDNPTEGNRPALLVKYYAG
ncbi:MAG: DNRLRE domain-containing protein [SAR202 cluster bacterium]|nr:DNRLRE domain-containing protein [SAR202 cluster bacterium]